MSFGGDPSAQGMQGIDPGLQQFILNETEKQKLQVTLVHDIKMCFGLFDWHSAWFGKIALAAKP